jgi:hypothetical protein
LLLFYSGKRECNVILFFRHAGAVYCLKNLFILMTNMIGFQKYARIILWGSTVHCSNTDPPCFLYTMSLIRIPVLSPTVLSFVVFVQTSQSDMEECCKTCNPFIKHPFEFCRNSTSYEKVIRLSLKWLTSEFLHLVGSQCCFDVAKDHAITSSVMVTEDGCSTFFRNA